MPASGHAGQTILASFCVSDSLTITGEGRRPESIDIRGVDTWNNSLVATEASCPRQALGRYVLWQTQGRRATNLNSSTYSHYHQCMIASCYV